MIKAWLEQKGERTITIYAAICAFGVYFCMYAFRKPFTASTYEGIEWMGLGLKTVLLISQIAGYALSKFIGIKIVSELKHDRRVFLFLFLIGFSWFALLLLSVLPLTLKPIAMFLNGFPLGMIWGLVFSYLEGRRFTEIMAASLSASFIISSDVVKSVGLWLSLQGVSIFWMPFIVGLIFIIPFTLFVYLINQLPKPSQADIDDRTIRKPMMGTERRNFVLRFWPGLIMCLVSYMLITAYRDFRDYFAVEIWTELGYVNDASVFTRAALPVAPTVLLIMGLMILVKKNMVAFKMYHILILLGLSLTLSANILHEMGYLGPFLWMVLVGIGLYTAYVFFASTMFDRMLAAFKYVGTAGFMIYLMDAFGYLGSVLSMLYKELGNTNIEFYPFFVRSGYVIIVVSMILMTGSLLTFGLKEKRYLNNESSEKH